MIKNKLDFKLINLAIITFIIFLIYTTSNFWIWLLNMAITIFTPFLLAFALAYALYPLLKIMIRKGVPKFLGVGIITILILGIFTLIVSIVIPLLFEQMSGLFSGIIKFVQDISSNYNLHLGSLQETLSNTFKTIINNYGRYVSDGAITIINKSIGILSMIAIIFFVGIYFLSDMKKIRSRVKIYLQETNKKTFNYIKTLDREITQYFNGLGKIIFIQFFEYSLAFFIIGHPNYLLLGILASLTSVIPYVGGIMTNIIALITAVVISPSLFLLTLIVTFVLPTIDGYIISPKVFGKTNKMNPLLTIFAVFTGGVLYGVMGIAIAIPTTIIIVSTFKYYKKDILVKIGK